MPIYEYYCDLCHGKFSHLARRLDDPEPPCPRCGNAQVVRLMSAANVVHAAAHHESELRNGAAQIDADDPRAAARFLKESGRLQDASGLYGSTAYRELIERRVAGAADADLADLVDDLVAQVDDSEAAAAAGALVLSRQVENRMGADGPPDAHDETTSSASESKERVARTPRSADDLGWG